VNDGADIDGARSVRIERATPGDLPAAVAVQHRAFMRVALAIGLVDPEVLDPIRESLEDVELAYREPGAVFLVARHGERPDAPVVGAVRGQLAEDGSVEVGRLVVDDGLEGRGIGRALMVAIEAAYPDTSRFALFTGREAHGPLHLYRSLGYRPVEQREFRENLWLVWMEKCREPRVDSDA
jgi:GNAT superfamily N-acetyltransferase